MSDKNELTIISPRSFAEAADMSKALAPSMSIPKALQGKPADVLAIVMRGAELGLPPMTALSAMHVINGKVTLSADAIGALVKRNREVCKYLRLVSTTDKAATYETHREGEPEPTRMSFTIEQAKRAGLLEKNPTWQTYPEAMLRARALTALCRAVYSDLVLGLYDPEEIPDAPSLPATQKPAEQPKQAAAPTNVVEGEVVSRTEAKPRRMTIDDKSTTPDSGEVDDTEAINACTALEELTALRRARSARWGQSSKDAFNAKLPQLKAVP